MQDPIFDQQMTYQLIEKWVIKKLQYYTFLTINIQLNSLCLCLCLCCLCYQPEKKSIYLLPVVLSNVMPSVINGKLIYG